MSGLPSAGKDTWIRENLRDWPVVSLDRFRTEVSGTGEPESEILTPAGDLARAHLQNGRNFIWNGTNLSRRLRAQCIRLFAEYSARVRIVYVEVDEATLKRQNQE